MRLDKIRIENMRLVGSSPLTVDFAADKNITLVMGDNGAGKTTLLDGIAYMVSPFIAQFPGQPYSSIIDSDVHLASDGRPAPCLGIEAVFGLPTGTAVARRYRKGSEEAPKSDTQALRAYAGELGDAIRAGESGARLPILAYYGTDRGNIAGPERRRYTSKTYERWDCYTASMLSATNFKRFFAWFDLMEDEERRERDRLGDRAYRSPVLETVRTALSTLLGENYSHPRIETRPLRFVVDVRDEDGVRELRIEQLSAGYKVMIAMVADLAARMAEGNPDTPTPLSETGIVLIDEIDLHLHARWQRQILSQLSQIFPNVQFVITTHSPVVVLGANDNSVQLIRLTSSGAEDISRTDMSNYDVSLILLSEAFSLPSVYSERVERAFARREELLRQGSLTPAENEELGRLNAEVYGLPRQGTTDDQQRAEQALLSWASQEGLL